MSDPERKDLCVECGASNDVVPVSGNIIPDGKTVFLCPVCREARAHYYQRHEVPKPLPKKPDEPSSRCCP